ncbi:hypothetical protein V2J09_023169 [Rumex salicifolius]
MAGGYPRGPSRKPPPSSSSHSNRKSRWESTSSAAGTSNHRSSISAVALKTKSSAGASSSDSKLANHSNHKPNPVSDKNPTPKRGNPNPSPRTHHHPNPHPNSAPRGPMPPPGAPYSLADSPFGPPPPPTYGFHMLERRTIVLADGSAHTYLALPLDYQDFNPPPRLLDHLPRFPPSGPDLVGPAGRFPPFGPMSPNGFRGGEDPFARNRNQNQNQDYWDSLGLDGRAGGAPEGSMKRKYGEAEGGVKDELARQRQHVLQYGNIGASGSPYRREDEFGRASKSMRIGGTFDTGMDARHHYHTVDPAALKMAFLKFAKLLNDSLNGQKKDYLENGKNGPLKCIACQRSSKDFPDVHSLVVHAYNSDLANLHLDHLGLHKALCVLMGWNYMKPPDNSRAYQFLPADEASVNQDDLILWPPTVMILNTVTGKGKDGQLEGMGNKAMDSKIRAMGFHNFKPKSLYNREGHLGIILIKFAADQAGLRQAIQLNEHFEKQNRGRRGWAQVQSKLSGTGMDTENNPMLVEVDPRTGENNRILYGHLFTAFDLDKADFETKKKAALESKRDYLRSIKPMLYYPQLAIYKS